MCLLVVVRVVMMVVGVLVAFVASHTEWGITSVVAFFLKTLLVFDSFRFPSILRVHSLKPEVFVQIHPRRKRFLHSLGHRASP